MPNLSESKSRMRILPEGERYITTGIRKDTFGRHHVFEAQWMLRCNQVKVEVLGTLYSLGQKLLRCIARGSRHEPRYVKIFNGFLGCNELLWGNKKRRGHQSSCGEHWKSADLLTTLTSTDAQRSSDVVDQFSSRRRLRGLRARTHRQILSAIQVILAKQSLPFHRPVIQGI